MRIKDVKVFKETHKSVGDPYVNCVFAELPLFSLEFRWQAVMNILLNKWLKHNEYDDDAIILITEISNINGTTITEDELKEINNVWNGFYEDKY